MWVVSVVMATETTHDLLVQLPRQQKAKTATLSKQIRYRSNGPSG
jgi:hypothetical protein